MKKDWEMNLKPWNCAQKIRKKTKLDVVDHWCKLSSLTLTLGHGVSHSPVCGAPWRCWRQPVTMTPVLWVCSGGPEQTLSCIICHILTNIIHAFFLSLLSSYWCLCLGLIMANVSIFLVHCFLWEFYIYGHSIGLDKHFVHQLYRVKFFNIEDRKTPSLFKHQDGNAFFESLPKLLYYNNYVVSSQRFLTSIADLIHPDVKLKWRFKWIWKSLRNH